MVKVQEVKKTDYGLIPFGKYAYKKRWDETDVDYLFFLTTDECRIDEKYKLIARRVLRQKRLIKNQLEWGFKNVIK